MSIKESRTKIGWSQALMAAYLGIPKRTIENWESGVTTPPAYVEKLIVAELERRMAPPAKPFLIQNSTVSAYAEICKAFAHDAAEWSSLPFSCFYTTDNGSWKESTDNAHNGIDVSWAYDMSDAEIDHAAAEKLFELLLEDVQTAVDDGWDAEQLAAVLEKFNL